MHSGTKVKDGDSRYIHTLVALGSIETKSFNFRTKNLPISCPSMHGILGIVAILHLCQQFLGTTGNAFGTAYPENQDNRSRDSEIIERNPTMEIREVERSPSVFTGCFDRIGYPSRTSPYACQHGIGHLAAGTVTMGMVQEVNSLGILAYFRRNGVVIRWIVARAD